MKEIPCGCCEGTQILTPQTTANRPGLSALAYRVGTHATFLQTMLARLSSADYPALARLTTRDAGDPSIALLDAWALVADVLTFYQERIANEGYLLTATERRSILELARLVGYRLRPGVAASVFLAFELDKGAEVEIPAGTRAQSLPGPGELPQPFETAEPLLTRAEWNALKPRLTQPQNIVLHPRENEQGYYIDTDTVYLEGITANLKPNDPLLFVSDPEECQAVFDKVKSVEIDAAANCTTVALQKIDEQDVPANRFEEVRTIIKEYLDLEAFGVAGTQMAGRVGEIMEETSAALRPDMAPGELGALLGRVLPALKEEHALAVTGGFSKLEPWVGGLVTKLEAHAGALAARDLSMSAGTEWEEGQIIPVVDGSSTIRLGGLVTSLATPPSIQPANALRLKRDLQVAFGAKSDMLPRLMTRFQPRLQGLLYKAWASTKITGPEDVQGLDRLEALRVEAAPFGHNAPLKPILDQEGLVVDHEEWPLTEPLTTSVSALLPFLESPERYAEYLAAWAYNPQAAASAMSSALVVRIQEGTTQLQQILRLFLDGVRPFAQTTSLGNHSVCVALGPLVRFARTVPEGEGFRVFVADDRREVDVIWPPLQKRDTQVSAFTNSLPPGMYALALLDQESDQQWGTVLQIEAGKAYTIVAVKDELAQGKVVHLRDDWSKPPEDEVLLRIVHVAADYQQPIDVKIVDAQNNELVSLCEGLEFAEHRNESHFRHVGLQGDESLQVLSHGKEILHPMPTLQPGNSYDLYVRSLVWEAPDPSDVEVIATERWDAPTDLALDLDFQDLDRHLWLHIDGLNVQDYTMNVQITPAYGKSWSLKMGNKVRETVEHTAVAIGFGQQSYVFYQARAPLPQDVRDILTLDMVYDQITPRSCIVIERPDPDQPDEIKRMVRQVESVRTVSQAAFGLTGKATQLTLDADWLFGSDTDLSVFRQTTVYAQGEELALAEEPMETLEVPHPVADSTIELDGLYDGLEPGRWLIVCGERTDVKDQAGNIIPGIPGAELVMLAAVEQNVNEELPGDTTHTVLVLANDLAYTYKRDTVTIYGNVAKATHGETREEALGSGDGSQGLQAFVLKQSPLTHLAAPTPAGAESTLEVRVNDVRWHESERLVDRGPKDRIYITRTDDENKTTVLFGDGKHGARLPTGVENVKAKYRSGIGKTGNLPAEQISLLATRPLGVKGVINPLPSTGGADRESRDQARRNAPLGVTALDRLVSVQDYADFCRTYAGIGKAQAAYLTTGWRRLVHLTIAGADDIPIDEQSDLYRNLIQALHRHGDPHLPLQVDLRELMFVVISANVRLLPDYLWESVEPQIRSALLEALGFDRRTLGQDILLGEVIRTVQGVPGVAYVDVDILGAIPEKITDENGNRRLRTPEEIVDKVEKIIQTCTTTGGPPSRIPVGLAQAEPGTIRPAQLAYLTADVSETLMLTELNS